MKNGPRGAPSTPSGLYVVDLLRIACWDVLPYHLHMTSPLLYWSVPIACLSLPWVWDVVFLSCSISTVSKVSCVHSLVTRQGGTFAPSKFSCLCFPLLLGRVVGSVKCVITCHYTLSIFCLSASNAGLNLM